MIDLEDALAPLVERVPEPPAVDRVVRRGRQRRRRRRGLAAATTLVILVAALGGAATIVSSREHTEGRGSRAGRGDRARARHDARRLTARDQRPAGARAHEPRSRVQRRARPGLGRPAVGNARPRLLRRPCTARGPRRGRRSLPHARRARARRPHDAVRRRRGRSVRRLGGSTRRGAAARPRNGSAFASELNAKETADGFLVIEPTDSELEARTGRRARRAARRDGLRQRRGVRVLRTRHLSGRLPDGDRDIDTHPAGLAGLAGERRVVVRRRRERCACTSADPSPRRYRDRRSTRRVSPPRHRFDVQKHPSDRASATLMTKSDTRNRPGA